MNDEKDSREMTIDTTATRVWEMTFDALPDGMIVLDGAGRIARVNRHAAEMMGYTSGEIIGRQAEDVIGELFGMSAATHWTNHRQAYHQAARPAHKDTAENSVENSSAKSSRASFEVHDKDGWRYLFSISFFDTTFQLAAADNDAHADARNETRIERQIIKGENSLAWSVVMWSDITELAGMQEQLSRSGKLASIGGLAAGVAHEINNPLAAITTCAEAMTRDLRDLYATADTAALQTFTKERNWNFYLEEIVRQALRGKAITRGLLDLTRERRAFRTVVSINQLVSDTWRVYAARPDIGQVRIELNLDESLETIHTDASMVRQIIDNLIGNAVSAVSVSETRNASSAHQSVSPRITLRTRGDGAARIFIEVEDNGSGIRAEILARIFDPFFTTKRGGQNSGLGLAMCASLADALGGSITVETREGEGSRFRLWLPRLVDNG